MKLKIDIDEDYYKIICKRVEENKPYHSPYEYEVIADGKPLEQEPVLDKLRAEIERQERWLMDTGYNACSVDIAFDAIKSVIAESEN